jgi:nucleotide-binding universal stress UspA family protein
MSGSPAVSILVGFNDSDASVAALQWAGDAASRIGARIDVLWVLPGAVAWELAVIQVDPDHRRRAMRERLRAKCRQVLGPRSLAYRAEVLEGSPTTLLLREAQRLRSSLVVVGTSHRGAVGDLLMGSVVHDLVHRAVVPVVAVPPAWHLSPRGATSAPLTEHAPANAADTT